MKGFLFALEQEHDCKWEAPEKILTFFKVILPHDDDDYPFVFSSGGSSLL